MLSSGFKSGAFWLRVLPLTTEPLKLDKHVLNVKRITWARKDMIYAQAKPNSGENTLFEYNGTLQKFDLDGKKTKR